MDTYHPASGRVPYHPPFFHTARCSILLLLTLAFLCYAVVRMAARDYLRHHPNSDPLGEFLRSIK